MLKLLYGASLGVVAFTLLFLAPSGKLMTSSAAPERVKRDTAGPSARSGGRTRSRYIFAGYYGK